MKVKHKQWFPVKLVEDSESGICLVCSTARGMDKVSKEIAGRSHADQGNACEVIQQ